MENKMSENRFVTAGKTKVVEGSILSPELGNLRLVLVPINEAGVTDTEMYNLLNKKWRQAKVDAKGWYSNHIDFKLGNIQTTAVQSDTWVVHCLFEDKDQKVNAKAMAGCLKKVAAMAKYEKASVHVSNLMVEKVSGMKELLVSEMLDKGTSVYFYTEAPPSTQE
jgi:hypothetical protein